MDKVNLVSNEVGYFLNRMLCGVVIIEMESRTIKYANDIALNMIGGDTSQVIGHICHDFICPARFNECPIMDKNQLVDNSEKVLLTQKGTEVNIIKSVIQISIDNKPYLLESFVDISHQKFLEEQTKMAGMTDTLTGLYNRRYLTEAAASLLSKVRNEEISPVAVMFDIDHFKQINDQYGHLIGDEVLSSIGKILRNILRSTDIMIRWGGEEFLVLLRCATQEQGMKLAEKIRKSVEEHDFSLNGPVTCSFGVAGYMTDEEYDHWIGRADYSMMRSKIEGRNRVTLWNGYIGLVELLNELNRKSGFVEGKTLIDAQQRDLIEKSTIILKACIDMKVPEGTNEQLCELFGEIEEHFHSEELHVRELGYPRIDEHIKKHRILIEGLKSFRNSLCGEAASLDDLRVFMIGEALIRHLKDDDQDIIRYINNLSNKEA